MNRGLPRHFWLLVMYDVRKGCKLPSTTAPSLDFREQQIRRVCVMDVYVSVCQILEFSCFGSLGACPCSFFVEEFAFSFFFPE
jgi:hypothetical protein